MKKNRCRFCGAELSETFADLGVAPLSNSYVPAERLQEMEPFYPLHVYVCSNCFLVQLTEFESPQNIFGDYAYFSSFSETWLKHAEAYASLMTDRLRLAETSLVVEIGSNDGYLLECFKNYGIDVLGVEPAANVAKTAIEKGIPTEILFFCEKTALELNEKGKLANLIVANNVLAHVPDLIDFVCGLKILLKTSGVITVEFPHLLRLIAENQFDTIYHEHFSYFSLLIVEKVFAGQGIRIFDVEEVSTHGGSLRLFACHASDEGKPKSPRVEELRQKEVSAGLLDIETYRSFAQRVVKTKCDVLEFFVHVKRLGKTVVGYGAPAKANTLLNYCGIGTDFIEFTVDRSPYKQGLYLPGTHIAIRHPDEVAKIKPDYLFILPWNLKDEIIEQMSVVRSWGGKFVIPIPSVEVL
ncbi:MAG: methyltransferase domain-containing protein [Candidatus Binatia bacterium]